MESSLPAKNILPQSPFQSFHPYLQSSGDCPHFKNAKGSTPNEYTIESFALRARW